MIFSSVRIATIANIIILLLGSTVGKSDEIPHSFFQTFGLAARAVWQSYQKDGEFDFEGFARDSLAQEFGGFVEAMDFATIAADLNRDPHDLIEQYLNSNESRKVSFALSAILWLHDRRFYQRVVELKASKLSIVREKHRMQLHKSFLDPLGDSTDVFDKIETVGDLAKIVASQLEVEDKDAYFLSADQKWMIDAQSIAIEPAEKEEGKAK
ncbi:MAG: hypothetical protein P1V20_16345 [Verrucomicrobiales bacterium]|nr:hypothetical protein [Verrucomicrobiales bacterium]